jgi:NADPH:quinone reductase-like Zn-dependent oxidoreductase
MKAIRYYRYGSPDVLDLQDAEALVVDDEDVLVRVKAASVNPLDFHFMRGTPYILRAQAGLFRPKATGLGADMAGYVEAVGRMVTAFQPGDEVFGARDLDARSRGGTFAEYVCIHQNAVILRKPANLTFEQAASVPVAAFTALQALRDKGRIQPGQKVLVNGAAGGVGTFVVQLAKTFGAEVTGVCSGRNVAMVRSIGADQVFDYTWEDFVAAGQRYDLLVDIAGSRTLSEYRHVLAPKGVLVGVGGPVKGQWIKPLMGPVKMLLMSPDLSQRRLRIVIDGQ